MKLYLEIKPLTKSSPGNEPEATWGWYRINKWGFTIS